ncbi:MAG TPA: hypothetical protein VKF36_18325 [Syntrophorhabdales bacterium]|nr:hypothetical protein [Syntrophorhabdales bacterium]
MVSLFAHGVFPSRKDIVLKDLLIWALLAGACLFSLTARASDSNFEIHVFPSETVDAGRTMVELHSNMAISGTTQKTDGVLPTQHVLNESLEVAHGLTSWFETVFYTAASVQPGMDAQYVGNRIMPRIRVPEQWDWPVGLGLGTAVTYQRRSYSTDTWTLQIVPIIDKRWGPWYLAANPAVGRALKGEDTSRGWEFSPSVKVSYDITRKVAAGFEYYASLGPLGGFYTFQKQQQLFSVVDLNLGPAWEFNFGAGVGLTGASDAFVVKMILGHRF